MDVVALKEAAGDIAFVRAAFFETIDGGGLVAEGFEEAVGEGVRVEGSFDQCGYIFFNLNSVQNQSPGLALMIWFLSFVS